MTVCGQSVPMSTRATTTTAILAALREGLISDEVAIDLFATASRGG